MIDIILIIVSVLAASFVWYRLGRQSVIDDLIKAYEHVCKINECDEFIIESLKRRLKEYEEKKKNSHERV